MEIMKFLKLTPKRVAVVLVVALLAAIASVAFQSRQNDRYAGRATVFVASVFGGSTFEVEPYIQNFVTNMQLDPILNQTAESTGVPFRELENGLRAVRPPNSSAVEVTFTGDSAVEARSVVTTASAAALFRITQEEAENAAARLAEANRDFDNAVARLSEFQTVNQVNDVNIQMQQKQEELDDARTEQANAASEVLRRTYDERIEVLQGEITQLGGLVNEFTRLQLNVESARSSLGEANTAQNIAQVRVTAAQSPQTIVPSQETVVSKIPTMVRSGLAAVVAVFVLGMLALFVLETRNQNRAQRELEAEIAEERGTAAA
jgi:hypothetical protein